MHAAILIPKQLVTIHGMNDDTFQEWFVSRGMLLEMQMIYHIPHYNDVV